MNRGIVIHQSYWKAYGTWHPESWRLSFAVLVDDEFVGAQELEGNDFPRLRTVDSASFLANAVRGRGIGKQMRRAVLGLAFGPMGAQAAITSAWHDNHASLGVSRALGYRPNGETFDRRGTEGTRWRVTRTVSITPRPSSSSRRRCSSTSKSGGGQRRAMPRRCSSRSSPITRLRYHFLSDGTTYHGAISVLVRSSAISYAVR